MRVKWSLLTHFILIWPRELETLDRPMGTALYRENRKSGASIIPLMASSKTGSWKQGSRRFMKALNVFIFKDWNCLKSYVIVIFLPLSASKKTIEINHLKSVFSLVLTTNAKQEYQRISSQCTYYHNESKAV